MGTSNLPSRGTRLLTGGMVPVPPAGRKAVQKPQQSSGVSGVPISEWCFFFTPFLAQVRR